MKENTITIVYGIHPINEVIRAKKRKIYDIYIEQNKQKHVQDILKGLTSYTKIHMCEKKKLEQLSQSVDHQGVVALVAPFVYQKNFFCPLKTPLILCCDSIQDTKNLGALLRSAYCTNFGGVIISDTHATEITGSVLKSSAGLCEHLAIYKTKHIVQTISDARKSGYAVLLADANGSIIDQVSFQKPLILVIGNEHQGINKKLLEYGVVVSLAQKEEVISYNASVAGGILMYHLSRSLHCV